MNAYRMWLSSVGVMDLGRRVAQRPAAYRISTGFGKRPSCPSAKAKAALSPTQSLSSLSLSLSAIPGYASVNSVANV
jgi:hypothetical protein